MSVYNEKYFDGTTLKQLSPKLNAFKTYVAKDGNVIGLFQGKRGARPDLDFKIKILVPGADKKSNTLPHSFWVVDLLLKIPTYKSEVREIIQYYIAYYARTKPFASVGERDGYTLETVEEITSRFSHIEQAYTPTLDNVAIMIELFCKNEKINPGAYMFRDLLVTIRDYIDGNKHYIEVLEAAKAGFR
ncbi:MAG TPA: hypothetical protein PKA42_02485 [Candidatus Paceibacterota bacterium]|nr:hypothetical protein [Candidatus Paceibacterota bacterium]HMO83011.1 hypothetical protein [Candidatus Paceibacterota bacterium]